MSEPLAAWLNRLPWLDALPEAWSVRRFSVLAKLSVSANVVHDDLLLSLSTSRGIVPRSVDDGRLGRTGEELERYWKVAPQQLVVNPMWLAHGSVAVSSISGVISPDYRVYHLADVLWPRYVHHLLQTPEYKGLYQLFVRGDTTYDRRVSKDDFHSLPIIVPRIAAQRAIATFLDRKTAAIDALIAKKDRLIERVQEKRQALIARAVTKGLDPRVSMKDSGIEWLGMIPAHWSVLPLKRRWRIVDCKHRTVPFVLEGIPLASIGEVQTMEVDLQQAKQTTREEYAQLIEGGRRPRRGDIIYSRNATVGAAAIVATDAEFAMGQDVCLIRSTGENQRFLLNLLRSPVVLKQLDSVMVGATFKRVNISEIAELVVSCPPTAEQDRIADYCNELNLRTERAVALVSAQLELLREYRQALVSAAVTGKLDIPAEDAA